MARGRNKLNVNEWNISKGVLKYQYPSESSNIQYRSTAEIDENGVFVLNYFLRSSNPVNCEYTQVLKNAMKHHFKKSIDGKILLIMQNGATRNNTALTNVQLFFKVKETPSNEVMGYVDYLIKDNVEYFTKEEFDAVVRQKYCDSAKKSMASKKTDAYCD